MKNRTIYFSIVFKILFLLIWSSTILAQSPGHSKKINGISFNGPMKPGLERSIFKDLQTTGANWVAIVPEATLERHSLKIRPDSLNHWWGATLAGSIEGIKLAKAAGLKVMLKPHIMLSDAYKDKQNRIPVFLDHKVDKTGGASWRGDFAAKKKKDWIIWEQAYEYYILNLAKVSESMNVDLLCIGSELKKSATKRPAYWRQLIRKVRKIYKGPLTYSANWDEYDHISFWDELDYIGIDAYFPVSWSATPKVKRTTKRWRKILKQIKKFHKAHQRPILITEVGYRNVSFAGRKPWIHDSGKSTGNNEAQANLYEAYFRAFQKKSWIAGSFFWQWFAVPHHSRNTKFSPQGKPALKVLKDWYGGVD